MRVTRQSPMLPHVMRLLSSQSTWTQGRNDTLNRRMGIISPNPLTRLGIGAESGSGPWTNVPYSMPSSDAAADPDLRISFLTRKRFRNPVESTPAVAARSG
jgi:hypothetical protein